MATPTAAENPRTIAPFARFASLIAFFNSTTSFWVDMLILHRYVLSQLLWVGGLLLLGLTVLLVFVGVVGEASRYHLGGSEIAAVLPFVVPNLMPFTIPATLLLTVCVVYGRMASDQEITATKAAGINIMALLMPSFVLAAVLSLCTFILTDQVIPWSRERIEQIITQATEKILLDQLAARGHFMDSNSGLNISVLRVDGNRLISPVFIYQPYSAERPVTLQADEATIEFDLKKKLVNLHLLNSEMGLQGKTKVIANKRVTRSFPLPQSLEPARARNLRIAQIRQELRRIEREIDELQKQQVIRSAFALTLGRFNELSNSSQTNVIVRIRGLNDRHNKLKTELHSRIAMAFSCLFFVFVGTPFTILQAKRQFLTIFFLCFGPVILVYYPCLMLMMNLAKYDWVDPTWGMWGPNAMLGLWGARELFRVLRN